MTLGIASGVTAVLLFATVIGPILLFVTANCYLTRGANCRSLDKLFIAFFVAVLIDAAMTLGAVLADVPLSVVLAAGLSDITANVVDASLFQDTLYGSYLAIGAALSIAFAKELAAVQLARTEEDCPQV